MAQGLWIPIAVGALLAAPRGDELRGDELDDRIAIALERARPALLRHVAEAQESRLALMCLAALHDGVPADDRVLARALTRLRKADIRDTYGLSLRLMVEAQLGRQRASASGCHADLRALLTHQTRDGGFGYTARGTAWDLSNTQYAALGLLAATRLGLDVEDEVFAGLVQATQRCASGDGGYPGYGYRPGSRPTLSMTCAGIAVLEICKRRFANRGVLEAQCRRGIEAGWRYLTNHRELIGDDQQAHNLYAHYGLERAAILSGRARVGDVDWYRHGAEMIAGLQTRSGAFVERRREVASAGDPVPTAFAVLFLRRAFRPDGPADGPTTPPPSVYCHALAADADADAIRAAATADAARGPRAIPDLLRALRSEHRARREAAARAVVRITGLDFRYHPDRDNETNALALRALERWWIDHRDRPPQRR